MCSSLTQYFEFGGIWLPKVASPDNNITMETRAQFDGLNILNKN